MLLKVLLIFKACKVVVEKLRERLPVIDLIIGDAFSDDASIKFFPGRIKLTSSSLIFIPLAVCLRYNYFNDSSFNSGVSISISLNSYLLYFL